MATFTIIPPMVSFTHPENLFYAVLLIFIHYLIPAFLLLP